MYWTRWLDELKTLFGERKGAAMVEYALLAGLIAVIAITTLKTLGNNVNNQFNTIATKL